jgi:transcriptional regulator with XRE-family HTH domain
MADRSLSQREIAKAVGLSQPTVNRILQKRRSAPAESADPTDPVGFVNSFEKGLLCLSAITRHYQSIVGVTPDAEAQDWRDAALAAYRAKFRNVAN